MHTTLLTGAIDLSSAASKNDFTSRGWRYLYTVTCLWGYIRYEDTYDTRGGLVAKERHVKRRIAGRAGDRKSVV